MKALWQVRKFLCVGHLLFEDSFCEANSNSEFANFPAVHFQTSSINHISDLVASHISEVYHAYLLFPQWNWYVSSSANSLRIKEF